MRIALLVSFKLTYRWGHWHIKAESKALRPGIAWPNISLFYPSIDFGWTLVRLCALLYNTVIPAHLIVFAAIRSSFFLPCVQG